MEEVLAAAALVAAAVGAGEFFDRRWTLDFYVWEFESCYYARLLIFVAYWYLEAESRQEL